MASLRGDTVTGRLELAKGRAIVDTLVEFPLDLRVVFSNEYVDDALARRSFAEALRMAIATRDAVLPTQSSYL
ncbi:hypothetical protein, partial [Gemmatimonas sp.]|uniref:hypothetical protein n=1 Tax=Gemmatimonas sp. TaxID=1962908 RepID=UPI00356B3074